MARTNKRRASEADLSATMEMPNNTKSAKMDLHESELSPFELLPTEVLAEIVKFAEPHPRDWFAMIRTSRRVRSVCEKLWPQARLQDKCHTYNYLAQATQPQNETQTCYFSEIQIDSEFKQYQASPDGKLEHLFCFSCRKYKPRIGFFDVEASRTPTSYLLWFQRDVVTRRCLTCYSRSTSITDNHTAFYYQGKRHFFCDNCEVLQPTTLLYPGIVKSLRNMRFDHKSTGGCMRELLRVCRPCADAHQKKMRFGRTFKRMMRRS